MKQRFQSVAEICDHINAVPEMTAQISHINRMSAKRVSEIFFVSVSLGGHHAMWRVESTANEDGAPDINISKTLGKEGLPAETAEQLTHAMDVLTLDLRQ